MIVQVKIISYKSPQRYAVRRTLQSALIELRKQHPQVDLEISEVKDYQEMQAYTPVLILPSLIVNEKLVCSGRFPHKEETVRWLQLAVESALQSKP